MYDYLTPSFIISVLIALAVHEWAHAFVAHTLGDPTAKYEGRLTLNPIAHIDPLGALLFLTVGFGWGKPVPVNPRYFRNHRRDTALVALAGPVSNLVLAFAAALCFSLFSRVAGSDLVSTFLAKLFLDSIGLNLALMAFNLLPIAPLDGSKILASFIPYRYEDQYDDFMQYGPYILLVILLLERVANVPLLQYWISGITDPVLEVMMRLF